jgi:glycerol-3-phosphate O-acyltransferase
VVDGEAQQLPYFRNNVLHLFAVPALIACLLGNNRSLDGQRLSEAVVGIYRGMRTALFLRWSEAELLAEIERVIAVFAERGLLRRTDGTGRLAAPETNSQEFPELHMIGETLRPMLGRNFLALSLLQQRGSGTLTRAMLEKDCLLLAQRLALLHGFAETETADKSDFANLVANLLDSELLSEDAEGLLHFAQELLVPLAHAELVLPADARQSIRRMAEQPAA